MKRDRKELYMFYMVLDIGTVCFLSLFVYAKRYSVVLIIGLLMMNTISKTLHFKSSRKELGVLRLLGLSRIEFVYYYMYYNFFSLFLSLLVVLIFTHLLVIGDVYSNFIITELSLIFWLFNTTLFCIMTRRL